MKPSHVLAAIVAIGAPALAQDRQAVVLAPEQAVTLRLDGSGTILAREDGGRASWGPFELEIARRFSGMTPPKVPAPAIGIPSDDSVPPSPPVQPGRLRLRFMSIAGQHSILILENGYDRAMVYRAHIVRGNDARATDVCLVMPMRFGFEHWPFPLDRIAISDIHLVPWRPGDPLPCA